MSTDLAEPPPDPVLDGVPLARALVGPPAPAPGIGYQLGELSAARDPRDPFHSLPDLAGARRVLDIGCGIGALLRWAPQDTDVELTGIDIDPDSVRYGARYLPGPRYLVARAEQLPFTDGAFDRVVSRVTLPYTDVPRALAEIARVLTPAGRVWLTCHPARFTLRQWRSALRHLRARDLAFRSYVLASGLWLLATGHVLPIPGRARRESFQTGRGMRRLLERHGFDRVRVRPTATGSLCITARRGPLGHDGIAARGER